VLLLLAAAPVAHCGSSRLVDWSGRAGTIVVRLSGGPTGAPDAPLDASSAQSYVLDVEVRSADGHTLGDFDGFLRVSARPGRVTLGPSEQVIGADIRVQNGRATGIPIQVQNAFGRTEVWVEDLGFAPPPAGRTSACSDQVDNDADGRTDYPYDPGCLDAMDDSEMEGTDASGLSAPLWFTNPTVATVQGRGAADPTVSPYAGEVVTFDSGFLVVTRVTRDGMTVSDVSDPGPFNHLYVYNHNTPAGVRVCDRLTSLSGIVGEYYKFTELNFPSWALDPWRPEKGPCPVPDPHLLTASDLISKTTMEGFESALVRVENVLVADQTQNCDLNADGRVNYRDYDTNACDAECECREACEKNPLCTEWSQYQAYHQWVVAVGGASGQRLLVVSLDADPEFDPFAPAHPKQIRSLTGTLRNMSFLKPPWILEPRCPDDIVIEGEPKPIRESCIFPRTGPEEEPN